MCAGSSITALPMTSLDPRRSTAAKGSPRSSKATGRNPLSPEAMPGGTPQPAKQGRAVGWFCGGLQGIQPLEEELWERDAKPRVEQYTGKG